MTKKNITEVDCIIFSLIVVRWVKIPREARLLINAKRIFKRSEGG